jgi:hypothetical protein
MKDPTITVFTTAWNSYEFGLPNLIDYYLNKLKVDKFIYADNFSTDDTISKLKARFPNEKRLRICTTPYKNWECYKKTILMNGFMQADDNDVFIGIDSDEVVYHPNFKEFLKTNIEAGKHCLSNFLIDVYNENDVIDEHIPFINNFNLCLPTQMQKTNIILRPKDYENIRFYNGHHQVDYNSKSNHFFPKENNDTVDQFVVYHFCYLSKEMWIGRKKKPANKLLSEGLNEPYLIENEGYWNWSDEQIEETIKARKKASITREKFEQYIFNEDHKFIFTSSPEYVRLKNNE